VAIGYGAGPSHQNTNSIAIGYGAGGTRVGSYSIAMGYEAGTTTESYSVAIGHKAGYNNTGSQNIAINSTALELNTTKSNAFFVKPIGTNIASAALYWDSSSGEIHTVSSDDRVKVNEVHIENATDTLLKLKPQNYDKLEDIGSSNVIGHESGLMAQDLWYDAPELRHMVILGKGAEPTEEKPLAPSDDPQDDPDYSAWGPKPSTVTYHQLIPYLVKSIQELETRIKVLEGG
jgi:hypothetical protein